MDTATALVLLASMESGDISPVLDAIPWDGIERFELMPGTPVVLATLDRFNVWIDPTGGVNVHGHETVSDAMECHLRNVDKARGLLTDPSSVVRRLLDQLQGGASVSQDYPVPTAVGRAPVPGARYVADELPTGMYL